MKHILHTGQTLCFDSNGKEIPCNQTGHDGEYRTGTPGPENRFELKNDIILDHLTGLTWLQNANINIFPCTWQDSMQQIEELNRQKHAYYTDWRLPNRNELRSLMSYQAKKPALPDNLPAENVFLGWYWTSTTAAIHPAYAWSIHMEGARMFYGKKDQYQLFWPVQGKGVSILPQTGQMHCFDQIGNRMDCTNSQQDGALQMGAILPQPRFTISRTCIRDNFTDLGWAPTGDSAGNPLTWQQALDLIATLNKTEKSEKRYQWRLPTINELASLTDCSSHSPALPLGHPFTALHDGYWSSTTSFFETDWAWVLYLNKGACGVGYKPGKTFHVWPVRALNDKGEFNITNINNKA